MAQPIEAIGSKKIKPKYGFDSTAHAAVAYNPAKIQLFPGGKCAEPKNV